MHHMTGMRLDFDKKLNASITNASPDGAKFVENFRQKHINTASLCEKSLLETGYIKVKDIFSIEHIFSDKHH